MLIRPTKYPLESEVGFLLRVAHANGLCEPKWLATNATKGLHQRLRICPHCLFEPGAYWFAAWQSGPPICNQHQCWLIDACPDCLKPFSFSTCRLHSCRCGQPYQAHCGVPVDPQIWKILYVDRVDPDVLMWMGSLAKHGLQGKPGKRASSKQVQEIAEFIELGSAAAVEWPKGFHALLSRIRIPQTGAKIALASSAFPAFAKRIRSIRDADWRARIEIEFLAYVRNTQGQESALLSRQIRSTSNAKLIAGRHGLSVERIKRVASQNALPVRVTEGGRKRYVIAPEIEERMIKELGDEVSTKQASAVLGLHPTRITALLSAQELTALGRGIRLASIRLFKDQILALATPVDSRSDRWASLSKVLKAYVPRTSTTEFFQAIKTRQIEVKCTTHPPSQTLGEGLLIQPDQVLAWLATRRAVQRCSDLKLDITHVAKALGVKPDVVRSLVLKGFLTPIETRANARAPQYFHRRDIDRFQEAFTSLKSLAAEAGIAPKQAPSWARHVGYEIVSGPTIDGCRQYFVRKAEIRKTERLAS